MLVVFAGAELFTGNTMVMLQGLARRRVTFVDVVLVWSASLAGNFVGALALAGLVDASGLLTTGARPGSITAVQGALGFMASTSSALTGGQLFLRAVLCNALGCLALWGAARAASDTAKLVVLWWAVLALVVTGFEYSVASMTTLSLAAMSGVGDWGDLGRNLVYTVPGNIVGGGVVVGLAYAWLGRPAAAAPVLDDVPDGDPTVVETMELEIVAVEPVSESEVVLVVEPEPELEPAPKPTRRSWLRRGVRTGTSESTTPTEEAAVEEPAARKTDGSKTTARKATARKATRKSATRKTTARKTTAATKRTARKTTARKSTARKAPARKAPARKTTARKAPARKTAARKTTARKAPARKAPARKAVATRKRTTRKATPTRRTATTRRTR